MKNKVDKNTKVKNWTNICLSQNLNLKQMEYKFKVYRLAINIIVYLLETSRIDTIVLQ